MADKSYLVPLPTPVQCFFFTLVDANIPSFESALVRATPDDDLIGIPTAIMSDAQSHHLEGWRKWCVRIYTVTYRHQWPLLWLRRLPLFAGAMALPRIIKN